MEDLVNMSLSDVIQLEKTKRKQTHPPKGHSKAKDKPKDKSKDSQKKGPQKKGPHKKKPQDTPKPILEENKRRLFIKNLSLDTENAAIFELFNQYGTLTRCGVNWDQLGRSKGTAIVQFEGHADAERALNESNGVELKGQVIEVAWA